MSSKRMIVYAPDGSKDIKTIDMNDLEALFKEFGAEYPGFGGFEVHFDYNDENDHDGMIECLEI